MIRLVFLVAVLGAVTQASNGEDRNPRGVKVREVDREVFIDVVSSGDRLTFKLEYGSRKSNRLGGEGNVWVITGDLLPEVQVLSDKDGERLFEAFEKMVRSASPEIKDRKAMLTKGRSDAKVTVQWGSVFAVSCTFRPSAKRVTEEFFAIMKEFVGECDREVKSGFKPIRTQFVE